MPFVRKKRVRTNKTTKNQNTEHISTYKEIANSTKGFQKLHWGKALFPDYRDLSGPKVSQKRINRAKSIVKIHFRGKKSKNNQKHLKPLLRKNIIKKIQQQRLVY